MRSIRIVNDNRFVTPKDAERMVYRGEACFIFSGIENPVKELRYLDEHEQRILRRAIAEDRERLMDDAMIENGRRVVYWNGDCEPTDRRIPGTVRS